MSRALTWVSGLLLIALAGGGVWLIVAPYVVGYQPRGAGWTLATREDVTTGGVLLGVSLLTLGSYLGLTLRAKLRPTRWAATSGASGTPGAVQATERSSGGAAS